MERYLKIVQQYDNKVSEATRQFEKSLDSSKSIRSRTRTINLAEAVLTLLKDSNDRISSVPRTLLTVRNWWEVFVHERYPKEYCLEYLKCSRNTYIYLVKALRPHIRPRFGALPQRQHLDMFKGISVEKQVAIMLHKIVRSTDYAVISGMFGIHKSTVHKIFYKAIRGINKHLLQILIKMPRREEAKKIARQLEDLSKIPQLIGSLESTHIPICNSGQTGFTNSKNYPSFVLQTVVDANCCFRDVSVRHPGSAEDRRVLEDSSIYRLHERVKPAERREINGLEMPYKIAAPYTYPLLPWLLTEFEPAATVARRTFNDHLRIVRYCSAAALARLKARFTILSQQIDVSYKIAPQIIAACCVIHNICENHQDPFPDEWLQESMQHCDKFPQPERTRDTRTPNPDDIRLRDVATDYLEKQLLMQNVRVHGCIISLRMKFKSIPDKQYWLASSITLAHSSVIKGRSNPETTYQ